MWIFGNWIWIFGNWILDFWKLDPGFLEIGTWIFGNWIMIKKNGDYLRDD
jgi:hypothetical protein